MSSSPSSSQWWLRDDCLDLYQEMEKQQATRVTKRAALMRFSVNQALRLQRRVGRTQWLEFGVHQGHDAARIAAFLASRDPQAQLVGFDSFEGLPEAWHNGQYVENEPNENTSNNDDDIKQPKYLAGTFHVQGKAPCPIELQRRLQLGTRHTTANVKNLHFVAGWFDETVAPYLEAHPHPIAFLHGDADLYSSTLAYLQPICQRRLLKRGSVLLFDEYWNHEHWQEGEYRAWHEMAHQYNIQFDYLGYHGPHRRHDDSNNSKCLNKAKPKAAHDYQSVCIRITQDM